MSAKIYQLTPPPATKESHKTVKRYCPVCGKAKTDQSFFNSECFRKLGRKENGVKP